MTHAKLDFRSITSYRPIHQAHELRKNVIMIRIAIGTKRISRPTSMPRFWRTSSVITSKEVFCDACRQSASSVNSRNSFPNTTNQLSSSGRYYGDKPVLLVAASATLRQRLDQYGKLVWVAIRPTNQHVPLISAVS